MTDQAAPLPPLTCPPIHVGNGVVRFRLESIAGIPTVVAHNGIRGGGRVLTPTTVRLLAMTFNDWLPRVIVPHHPTPCHQPPPVPEVQGHTL